MNALSRLLTKDLVSSRSRPGTEASICSGFAFGLIPRAGAVSCMTISASFTLPTATAMSLISSSSALNTVSASVSVSMLGRRAASSLGTSVSLPSSSHCASTSAEADMSRSSRPAISALILWRAVLISEAFLNCWRLNPEGAFSVIARALTL